MFIHTGDKVDYIAVIYRQRDNKLLDVFTSEEAYERFAAAIEKDKDFQIVAVYAGDFVH